MSRKIAQSHACCSLATGGILPGGYAHVVLGSEGSKAKALALNGTKVGKKAGEHSETAVYSKSLLNNIS